MLSIQVLIAFQVCTGEWDQVQNNSTHESKLENPGVDSPSMEREIGVRIVRTGSCTNILYIGRIRLRLREIVDSRLFVFRLFRASGVVIDT